MGTTTIIILAVAAAIVLWLIVAYNRFIRLKKRTEEAWSDIDVQLKRRHDLIPNLVETVKGYATHEREAFENVTRARAEAISAQGAAKKAEAENMLSGALKSLFAVAEAYPQLRASENFSRLQEELADTENKIQAARRFYNGNVRDLNTALEIFPSNIVAKMFGFKSAEFFEIEGGEKEPVQVKF
jgi:LemA protein